MPTRHMARRFPRNSRPRRRTQWAEYAVSGVAAGAVGHGFNSDLLSTYATMPGSTLTGLSVARVHLRIAITSAVAAGDGFKWGLIVGNGDDIGAYTTGTGSNIVNPVDLPYSTWMMIERREARPGYSDSSPNNHLLFDVRSRRRLRGLGDTLILSVANTAAAASLTFDIYCRTLLALP